MSLRPTPADVLRAARVDPPVFDLRPDYRVALLAVDGLPTGPDDGASDALRLSADAAARSLPDPIEELPHVKAWREAYRAFGAKPQRTRNSLEALLRRARADGLPSVNRLTDSYNAISVLHRIPLGGEDLHRYVGGPHLRRADGDEVFDTTAGGEPVIENPEPGEVVWCDDEGVTCRRWNWRQGRRTHLTDRTTAALFIFDALDPLTDDALTAAVDDLSERLSSWGAEVTVERRIISRFTPTASS